MGRLAEEDQFGSILTMHWTLFWATDQLPSLLFFLTLQLKSIVASTIITTDAGESEEESPVDDGSSSITTTTTTTEGDDKLSSQANQKLSTGIRERPPKKTKEEKTESVMKNVVKDVVEAQQRSDEMFLKMEEKRMQYEADQKKQEREFQLQMMSMIYGRRSHHSPPAAGNVYSPQANSSSYDPYGRYQSYD